MAVKNITLDDISAIIGFTPTLRLSAWFGDGVSNLYVPAEVQPDSTLVKLIGEAAARRLSEEWGNEFLSIPFINRYEVDTKRRAIARMLSREFGTREIAAHLGMSERRVQQICREMEAEGLIEVFAPVRVKRRDNRDESPSLDNWMRKTSGESA